ncbi:MAG: HAMP domain-containing sensor histidine kinase, partial [Planctomycetota bacterium]
VADAAIDQSSASSPLKWSLAAAWTALAAACAAVALLLHGVLALSERRAAFVSSVTHELRTPLTTFRMYAEMLARDMLPDAQRRREYLQTLRTEAERLTHLVENVLSYARLERGRKPRRSDRVTAEELIQRIAGRLTERAQQSSMTLELDLDDRAARLPMRTDSSVVEQILFNLVDNAAKYAARAEDRRIELSAAGDDGYVDLCVRDHGPGFADMSGVKRAPAFHKSAQQAAESAPGVGLGLALCRRLAIELGGKLELVAPSGDGAAVALRLPVEA